VALIGGSALLIALSPARGALWAGSAAFLTGIGMGFGNTVLVLAAQSSVPWRQRGSATSMGLFMRMLGESVAAALHQVYLVAGVLALIALGAALLFPAGINAQHAARD